MVSIQGRMPIAAQVEAQVTYGFPPCLDIVDPGLGTVHRCDLLAGGRELLKRHAAEDLARAVDDAVEGLGLQAVADFIVLDALNLRRAAAQVIEAGEVNALVDARIRRHVRRDLVVRARAPRTSGVPKFGALAGARRIAAHALVVGAVGDADALVIEIPWIAI